MYGVMAETWCSERIITVCAEEATARAMCDDLEAMNAKEMQEGRGRPNMMWTWRKLSDAEALAWAGVYEQEAERNRVAVVCGQYTKGG